jgi:hypothetical protein
MNRRRPLKVPASSVDIPASLRLVWKPAGVLGLQALWIFTFLYTGLCIDTASRFSFHNKKVII